MPSETGKVDAHLHIFAAKSSGEVIGGHLIEAEVFATCEIILSRVHRRRRRAPALDAGGVDTLFFEET